MLNLLARLLPRVPDNRIVAFVIPLVTPPIAGAAGLITTWLAEHLPGIHVNQGQATAFGITVATGLLVHAIAGARDWMKGHHLTIPPARPVAVVTSSSGSATAGVVLPPGIPATSASSSVAVAEADEDDTLPADEVPPAAETLAPADPAAVPPDQGDLGRPSVEQSA